MSKQVVLITGALTGIGRATAVAFAAAGANVVVAGRREEDDKQLERELRELRADAQFVKADARHEPEIQSLVDDSETVWRARRSCEQRGNRRSGRACHLADPGDVREHIRNQRARGVAEHET